MQAIALRPAHAQPPDPREIFERVERLQRRIALLAAAAERTQKRPPARA